MDAEKLKGLAIVSLGDGAQLGRVDDVLFGTRRRSAAWGTRC
jgi:sporulation protein YlmC with PRC-barrel domain